MTQSAAKEKTQNVNLSPPWVTQYNKLLYTIGNDPAVKVGHLLASKTGYFVRIRVNGRLKARALATLLRARVRVRFGTATFRVIVLNQRGVRAQPYRGPFTARQIVRLFRIALNSNRLFRFTGIHLILGTPVVYPVFAKKVIQFFNNDLSDYYQNFNGVAAFVFRDVMKRTLSGVMIDYSTSAPHRLCR